MMTISANTATTETAIMIFFFRVRAIDCSLNSGVNLLIVPNFSRNTSGSPKLSDSCNSYVKKPQTVSFNSSSRQQQSAESVGSRQEQSAESKYSCFFWALYRSPGFQA